MVYKLKNSNITLNNLMKTRGFQNKDIVWETDMEGGFPYLEFINFCNDSIEPKEKRSFLNSLQIKFYNLFHREIQKCGDCGHIMKSYGISPGIIWNDYWSYHCTVCSNKKLFK